MKVFILESEIELENELKSVEKLYSLIEETIKDGEYHFSHLEVDGVPIYEDLEGCMEDNIENIENVRVITLTIKDFIYEVIETSKDYFNRAIPAIENLSDEFYSEPGMKGWDQIKQLFDGINWIFQSFQSIDGLDKLESTLSKYEKWNEYAEEVHKLAKLLPKIEEALENKDNVLTGDLLSYEIVPIFKSMKSSIDEV